MLVAIVIIVVVVALFVVMRWADRRDKARRSGTRRTGDIGSAIRAGKEEKLRRLIGNPRDRRR